MDVSQIHSVPRLAKALAKKAPDHICNMPEDKAVGRRGSLHPEVCDEHTTRGVTRWSGYLSDTLETTMHLMTSHTFQLSFLLPELFPFSDDLDTEQCWSLPFSCPTPCSPQPKSEIKAPPGQSGYVLFLLPWHTASRLEGAAPCTLPRETEMLTRCYSTAWLGSNFFPLPLGKIPRLKSLHLLRTFFNTPCLEVLPFLALLCGTA